MPAPNPQAVTPASMTSALMSTFESSRAAESAGPLILRCTNNMSAGGTCQGRRAGDPPALVSDNRRILETFSWQPRYGNLDTIETHALEWEKKLAAKAGEKEAA
jgi:hypothetical protein